jgi:hypothetical protein
LRNAPDQVIDDEYDDSPDHRDEHAPQIEAGDPSPAETLKEPAADNAKKLYYILECKEKLKEIQKGEPCDHCIQPHDFKRNDKHRFVDCVISRDNTAIIAKFGCKKQKVDIDLRELWLCPADAPKN